MNCSGFGVVSVGWVVAALASSVSAGGRDFAAAILLARTSTPPVGAGRELQGRLFVCGEVSGEVDLLRLSAGASAFALISP